MSNSGKGNTGLLVEKEAEIERTNHIQVVSRSSDGPTIGTHVKGNGHLKLKETGGISLVGDVPQNSKLLETLAATYADKTAQNKREQKEERKQTSNGEAVFVGTTIEGKEKREQAGGLSVVAPPKGTRFKKVIGTEVKKDATLITKQIGGVHYVGAEPPPEVVMEFAKQSARRQETPEKDKQSNAAVNPKSVHFKVRSQGLKFNHPCSKRADEKVQDVMDEIERMQGKSVEIRLKQDGESLDPQLTIKDAGVKDNDVLWATEIVTQQSSVSGPGFCSQRA